MNSDIVDPMPPSQAHPWSAVQLTPSGNAAIRSLTAPSGGGNPQWFADYMSQDYGEGHASSRRSAQTDSRVRERKERHHDEG